MALILDVLLSTLSLLATSITKYSGAYDYMLIIVTFVTTYTCDYGAHQIS